MLVLTRRLGEAVRIGSDVHVTVVAVDGDRVRIGIAAPPEVRILRTELLERDREGPEDDSTE
jgi:carbon storage regulator